MNLRTPSTPVSTAVLSLAFASSSLSAASFEPIAVSKDSATGPQKTGTLNGQPVWEVIAPARKVDGITRFGFSPGLGASTTSLQAKVHGEILDVFPVRDLKTIDLRNDPNSPFKVINTPLFPNTNRLLPKNFSRKEKPKLGSTFVADVEGIRVRMPANHRGSKPEAIPNQLHGLLFAQPTKSAVLYSEQDGAVRTAVDFSNFFGEFWTGKADVRIGQSIENGAFLYEIVAKNAGKTDLPVGFGSHPYFRVPSGNPANARLVIPSKRAAEIDNLDDVLPSGRWLPLTKADDPLNFRADAKGEIDGKFLDNYFALDPSQPKVVELIDRQKKVKYRMTGLTENIVGVQVYYPQKGEVIAIEMVTHHPDPRRELWGKEPTGMKVLKPGETARYAYKIEALPL